MKLAPAEHLHGGPGHSAKLPRSGSRSLLDRAFAITAGAGLMDDRGDVVAIDVHLAEAETFAVIAIDERCRAHLPASCVGAVVTATGDAIDLASAATGLAGHVSLEVVDVELATNCEAVSVAGPAADLVGTGWTHITLYIPL